MVKVTWFVLVSLVTAIVVLWVLHISGPNTLLRVVILWAFIFSLLSAAWCDGRDKGLEREPPMLTSKRGLMQDVQYERVDVMSFFSQGKCSVWRILAGKVIPGHDLHCISVRSRDGTQSRVVLHDADVPPRFYWNRKKGVVPVPV